MTYSLDCRRKVLGVRTQLLPEHQRDLIEAMIRYGYEPGVAYKPKAKKPRKRKEERLAG